MYNNSKDAHFLKINGDGVTFAKDISKGRKSLLKDEEVVNLRRLQTNTDKKLNN